MIIHDCEQGDQRWHELRCGIPTASEFGKIITPKEMKLSSQARPYMYRLLGEWMTGHAQEMIETEYMQIGKELEHRAVDAYCFLKECEVQKVGFVTTDDGRFGCSPDRLTKTGGVEIKTHPQAIGVHVQAMVERGCQDQFKAQVQGCIWICERDYWDLVSYSPELPAVVVRVQRDEKYIAALKPALESFWDVMQKLREDLTREYGPFERKRPAPDDFEGMGITQEDIELMVRERFPRGEQ
jgi:hypothetical protein